MILCSSTKFLFLHRNISERMREQCERIWAHPSWLGAIERILKQRYNKNEREESENIGVSGCLEKWGGKSGRGDTFGRDMQKILKVASDNEKRACYEVLILYGPSGVETIKMTHPTLAPKTPS